VQNYALIRKAVKLAKQAGLKVSLDMASYNVVEEHLDFLKEVIQSVNILFANEDEARSFTNKEPHDAVIHISEHCDIAIVKVGSDGSHIKSADKKVHVPALRVKSIDTTGAGDLYAAGFLYGYAHDFPLEVCGNIGTILAAGVIETLGPKIEENRWPSILNEIQRFTSL
jgi:sugar/nucleoside kinase (ribokinase family)